MGHRSRETDHHHRLVFSISPHNYSDACPLKRGCYRPAPRNYPNCDRRPGRVSLAKAYFRPSIVTSACGSPITRHRRLNARRPDSVEFEPHPGFWSTHGVSMTHCQSPSMPLTVVSALAEAHLGGVTRSGIDGAVNNNNEANYHERMSAGKTR